MSNKFYLLDDDKILIEGGHETLKEAKEMATDLVNGVFGNEILILQAVGRVTVINNPTIVFDKF